MIGPLIRFRKIEDDMTNTIDSGRPRPLTALIIANALMGLLLVVFAIGFIYIQASDTPAPDAQTMDRYFEVARERLAEHSEVVEQELMALASETVAPIGDAVYDQARRDFPKYVDVLEREGDVFLENVEQIFLRQVKDQYHTYLAVHREVLRQEFPQNASDENVDRVMREFEQTFDRIVERYYLDEFRREAKETGKLWTAIQPFPLPGPNEPSLQEQLADYSSDWTMLALVEPDVATPASNVPTGNSQNIQK
jgi:hypothetical protein